MVCRAPDKRDTKIDVLGILIREIKQKKVLGLQIKEIQQQKFLGLQIRVIQNVLKAPGNSDKPIQILWQQRERERERERESERVREKVLGLHIAGGKATEVLRAPYKRDKTIFVEV